MTKLYSPLTADLSPLPSPASPWEAWLKKLFYWLLLPGILINASGLFVTILEPDGALYATIAKTIAQTNDFINLRVEGRDWLDKPHFPFWMAALSYKVFGINGFAYKLPALLFWAAGGWYTYRFAYAVYSKSVAQLAVLIYVSAAHLVISNNDVRAEPYLTGLVIGSVFHFYKASRTKAGLHLVMGSLLAACAIMTKGPFVLITIASGFIVDWILGKQWRQFLNIRWWIALALIALLITPELYCLYVQFDLHPEKIVFGHSGVSGIRFFFWDSQFGRFFNTGPIKGSGDPFFYFHTLLWAFLPWSLLLYAAIARKFRDLKKGKTVAGDAICLGAAIISFTVFSLSRFQLPHYLNMLFPFFSILTAGYLFSIHKKSTQRIFWIIQNTIVVLLSVLILFLCSFFHFRHYLILMALLAVLSVLPFLLFRGRNLTAAAGRSYWAALLACGFVTICLYPSLLRYQAGSEAGRYISGMQAQVSGLQVNGPVYMPVESPANYSFEFYSRLPVQLIAIDSLPGKLKDGAALLFQPEAFSDTLIKKGWHVQELRRFPYFHISQLTGQFLDYRTRQKEINYYSVVRVFR